MRLFSVFVLVVMCTGVAAAQGSPVQLGLFPPLQIVPEHQSVSAFRLSLIYGKNVNMSGLDMSLVGTTTGNFSGVQFGLVGLVDGNSTGWQWNAVSITNGSFKGLQGPWGIYNSADYVNGVQIALVNSAGSMKGIQLGLLNFIKKGGFMPFFPIVNWGGL
jgi:hypothetical protein